MVHALPMLTPETPDNEAERLQALQALCILDTPEEERFDRFTRLAQHVFQVPIAVVTLVDRHRQWFKSHQGLAASETSRQVSFCGHTILDQAPMIVPDALKDSRFADNPLVLGDPNIRFYAGAQLRSRDGYPVGVLCIIDTKPRDFPDSDISALRDLADCVQHELQGIEQMKSEFVSTVSHELRTPLTSIRGALGLVEGLYGASLPTQAHTLLETASRNAERLTLLINDILDLEKIESGNLEFHFEALDIGLLAAQAIADNEGCAAQHNVQLQLTPCLGHLTVMGDSHRLMQVFSNLLSNAIKYSPPGEAVTVAIKQLNNRVRVSVSDLGRGIPESYRARVFERFVQVDSSDSRDKGGTGLGLSITKAIVLRHSGDIDFQSVPGAGTTFYFDLPLRESPPVKGEASGADVLICEDDLDTSQVLRLMLQKAQISSHVAHSVTEARHAFTTRQYAVILLDLTLADGSSLPLLDEVPTDCKVVIFSAEKPQLGRYQSKVAAVLTKTQVSDDQLLDTLRRLIARQGKSNDTMDPDVRR